MHPITDKAHKFLSLSISIIPSLKRFTDNTGDECAHKPTVIISDRLIAVFMLTISSFSEWALCLLTLVNLSPMEIKQTLTLPDTGSELGTGAYEVWHRETEKNSHGN